MAVPLPSRVAPEATKAPALRAAPKANAAPVPSVQLPRVAGVPLAPIPQISTPRLLAGALGTAGQATPFTRPEQGGHDMGKVISLLDEIAHPGVGKGLQDDAAPSIAGPVQDSGWRTVNFNGVPLETDQEGNMLLRRR